MIVYVIYIWHYGFVQYGDGSLVDRRETMGKMMNQWILGYRPYMAYMAYHISAQTQILLFFL